MQGTLVNDSNLSFFMPILDIRPTEDDLVIGVIEKGSGTACGVLRAEAEPDNRLILTYIYVASDFRNKGAGSELMRFFLETAYDLGAKSIGCCFIGNPENAYLRKILDKAGFVDESDELNVQIANIEKFDLSSLGPEIKSVRSIPLRSLPESERFFLPVKEKEYYNENVSIIAVDNASGRGMILLHPVDGKLSLENLEASGAQKIQILYALIRKAVINAKESGAYDEWIIADFSSSNAKAIMAKLTAYSSVKFTECYYFNLHF